MDTITLVDRQIADGQQLLDGLDQDGFGVRAACWGKPAEEDRWSLYIASPVVDQRGPLAAYREVSRVLRPLDSPWVTASDVRLVGEKSPVAAELADIQQRFGDELPARTLPQHFHSRHFEDIYVYPPGKTEVTIYGLIYRGEPSGTLHLSLEPHRASSRLSVEGPDGLTREYPAVTGLDWRVAAPAGAVKDYDEYGFPARAWTFRGHRRLSGANEVWSLANLRMHGFRFLHEPTIPKADTASRP